MDINPEILRGTAAEAVSQLFTAAKADLTNIEANLWLREIDRLGPARMLSFVEFWASGEGQSSAFNRAPKVQDFLLRADPDYIGAEGALEKLRAEIASVGCWASPQIKDLRLIAAIGAMGGWAKVNQDCPDPSDDFAYKRFAERFRGAWIQAEAKQVQGKLDAPPLLGLIAAPTQLRLAPGANPPESTLETELLGCDSVSASNSNSFKMES
jgi:hypothetical protein